MMKGTLLQLNVSKGGVPKLPVLQARVTADGVEGDVQKNKKYHGGPNRAVCIFSTELYDRLRSYGIDLAPGSVGENFTTTGFDLQRLAKGRRLRVGDDCLIEITDVRVPCGSLKKWNEDLPELIVGYSGWVARVVEDGYVKPGDVVETVD
jgi:MOSC domain-containing protein YiiM